MKKTKLLSALAVSTLALPLTANADRTYDNIIRPFATARSLGMGGVRYSTGLYEDNFFANPARMIDNPHWRIDVVNVTAEVNNSAISNISKLTGGGDEVEKLAETAGSNNHFRIQTVLPAYYSKAFWNQNWAAALGVATNTQGDIGLRRSMSLEPNVFTDIGPVANLTRRFLHNDRLAIGVNAHYMYRLATRDTFSTIDYIRGQKFDKDNAMGEGSMLFFDLGTRYDIPWQPAGFEFQAAFAVNNVADTKFSANKPDLVSGFQPAPIADPRTLNFGLSAHHPNFLHFMGATFAAEIQDIGNNSGGSLFRTLHFGGELELKETLYLRAGLNQGYLAAGIGFDLPILKIDVSTYGEEMSLNTGGMEDRRYAVRIGLAL